MTDVVRVVKRRQQRRRSVGKAYDTAIEVADLIPPDTRLLDVGCGNGFVAHHLNALLATRVTGVDLGGATSARIKYLRYDGTQLPAGDDSYDGVLLSYVLHHVQDIHLVLNEVCRVLRKDGLVVIYEDVPQNWWDNVPCFTHDLMWRGRTGPCTFRRRPEWMDLFDSYGFEVVSDKGLSRWRNVFHPVKHRLYVLKATGKRRASAKYENSFTKGN